MSRSIGDLQMKNQTRSGLLLYAIFGSYFAYGLFTAATGSLSVPIMATYALDAAQRGLMITMQGLGSILVVLFSLLFGDRLNKYTLFMSGLLAMGLLGIVISFQPGAAIFTFLLFLWGSGIMLVDTTGNSLISDNFRATQNKHIPHLHLSFGVGMVLSNLITLLVLSQIGFAAWPAIYLVYGSVSLLAALFFMVAAYLNQKSSPYGKTARSTEKLDPGKYFGVPATWKIFSSMFLYSVFLCSIWTWLPYQWEKELGYSHSLSMLAVSIFYLGALFSRLLLPVFLKKHTPQKLIFTGCILGALAAALAFIMPIPAIAILLTVLGGFLTGAIIPVFTLLAFRIFPEKTSFAAALVMISMCTAAFITPWIAGEIAKTASMTLALLLSCLCLLASAPIAASIKSGSRQPEPAQASRHVAAPADEE